MTETVCTRGHRERELTEISEPALGVMKELGVILLPFVRLVQLQNQRPPRHDPFESKRTNPKLAMKTAAQKLEKLRARRESSRTYQTREEGSRAPRCSPARTTSPNSASTNRNRAQIRSNQSVSVIKP
jgi:hypothetical protein